MRAVNRQIKRKQLAEFPILYLPCAEMAFTATRRTNANVVFISATSHLQM